MKDVLLPSEIGVVSVVEYTLGDILVCLHVCIIRIDAAVGGVGIATGLFCK